MTEAERDENVYWEWQISVILLRMALINPSRLSQMQYCLNNGTGLVAYAPLFDKFKNMSAREESKVRHGS